MTDLQTAQENLQYAQAIVDNLKAQLEDPFKDLKKAYSEGAIIEYTDNKLQRWGRTDTPHWQKSFSYRIKDNISISSWQAHKDLIKQWWDGAEIEYHSTIDGWKSAKPTWHTLGRYRVKQDKWKLPEYEDGSTWTIDGILGIQIWDSQKYTKSGRRRATKELAERTAKASKTRDLLEAYRDYLEPEWKDDKASEVFYIYKKGNYRTDSDWTCRTIGTVYMSEDTAEQIVDALNKGEITL